MYDVDNNSNVEEWNKTSDKFCIISINEYPEDAIASFYGNINDASYEELLDIMSKVSNFSTNNLLDELEEGKKSQKEKIKSDIWANQVEGSSRDEVNGEKTIDAGFSIYGDLADTFEIESPLYAFVK